MSHLSYEESKKVVFRGLFLLAAVTLVEVFFSLVGKGHVIHGLKGITWLHYLIGLMLIGFSLSKAYFIIYEFMHMRYEVKGLAMTVLLPTVLLIWAIIAFFQEGNSWKSRRQQIQEKNMEEVVDDAARQESMLLQDAYILRLDAM